MNEFWLKFCVTVISNALRPNLLPLKSLERFQISKLRPLLSVPSLLLVPFLCSFVLHLLLSCFVLLGVFSPFWTFLLLGSTKLSTGTVSFLKMLSACASWTHPLLFSGFASLYSLLLKYFSITAGSLHPDSYLASLQTHLSFMVVSTRLPTYKHFSDKHHIASCCSPLFLERLFCIYLSSTSISQVHFLREMHPSHYLISSSVFFLSPHLSLLVSHQFLSFLLPSQQRLPFFLCCTHNSLILPLSEEKPGHTEEEEGASGEYFYYLSYMNKLLMQSVEKWRTTIGSLLDVVFLYWLCRQPN